MVNNKRANQTTKQLKETIRDLEWQLSQAIKEIEYLRGRQSQSLASYLAACRSVGGITLPPGQ